MIRALLLVIIATLVYVLALDSIKPWDFAWGALIASALLLLARTWFFAEHPSRAPGLAQRLVAFVPFAAVVALDVARGTWQVALVLLRIRPLVRPGLVIVPIEDRTPAGVVVTGLTMTLSPGSYLVDVDWERGVMLFHVLDARDPDQVRRTYQHMYRRYQRPVFP